jgi:hypothetical protein
MTRQRTACARGVEIIDVAVPFDGRLAMTAGRERNVLRVKRSHRSGDRPGGWRSVELSELE